MYDISLNFAPGDEVVAGRLDEVLKHQGYRTRLDQNIFTDGSNAVEDSANSMKKAKTLIFLLSETSGRSEWVERDYLEALESKQGQIVPVLLDNSAKENIIWPLLSNHTAVDLSADRLDYSNILAAVDSAYNFPLDSVGSKSTKWEWVTLKNLCQAALLFGFILALGHFANGIRSGEPGLAKTNHLEKNSSIFRLVEGDDIWKVESYQATIRSGVDHDLEPNFSDASLEFASLSYVFLEGFDLGGSKLFRADLRYSRLKGANLSRADLQSAAMDAVDLREASLERARLVEANLSRADLRSAILDSANLQGASLAMANLEGARLFNSFLHYADFSEANLTNAILDRAQISKAILTRANLSHASLRNADLSGADLSFADLSNADLTFANLRGATLLGTNLDNTSLDYRTLLSIQTPGYCIDQTPDQIFREFGIENWCQY